MIWVTGALFVAIAGGRSRRLLVGLASFALLSVVGVPFSLVGMTCLVVLIALQVWVFLVIRPWTTGDEFHLLIHDLGGSNQASGWSQRPILLVLLISVAFTVVLSIGRIWSFPDPFPIATVAARGVTLPKSMYYVGSNGQTLVLGVPETKTGNGRIFVLRADTVIRMELGGESAPGPFPRSLISRAGIVPLTSFYPIFRQDP